MEGLANECYNLIVNQRQMGASYSTVFNMAWYALKPLPLGKKDKSNIAVRKEAEARPQYNSANGKETDWFH